MKTLGFFQHYIQRVGLYTLSNIIVSGSALLLVTFMTRYLSTDDLGIIFLGQTFTLLFSTVIGLGSVSIIQPIFAKNRRLVGAYIGRALTNSSICFMTLGGLMIVLGSHLANALSVPVLLLWLAFLAAPLLYLMSLSQSSFQMTNEAFKYFKQVCWNIGTSVPFTVALVLWITPSWTARIAALLLGGLFAAIYGLPKLFSHNLEIGDGQVKKELLIRGLPVVVHAISTTLFNQTDKLLIGYVLSMSDVGIYGTSAQFASIISTLGATLAIAYAPTLYQALEDNTRLSNGRARSVRRGSILFIFVIGAFLGIGMTGYHELILGSAFEFRSDVLLILCAGHFFFAIYHFYSGYFYYFGNTLLLAFLTISLAVLNAILAYVFVQNYGLIGPAYAVSLSFFLALVSAGTYARYTQKSGGEPRS